MSLHLLMYFTHWINLHLQGDICFLSRLKEIHARWIFVLLSRVEDYVTPNDMNLLRGMARACLGLIKDMQKKRVLGGEIVAQAIDHQAGFRDPIAERSCWMIVSIIAGIWGQRDLWTEAEAMLADLDL
jgi:hypothetical protein